MLAFALRLSNLELLPIFYDEALYLEWARKTYERLDLNIALNEVSTLQVWLIALFYGMSPSALWVGRFVSVMAGVLTAALCYAIAWELYANKRVAQLAALLYAVVPYAVFHDRLAQNDGILALFLALVVYLTVLNVNYLRTRSSGRPHKRFIPFVTTLFLFLALGLAVLTKRSGILFMATPLLAVVILQGKVGLQQGWRWLIGACVGSVLIVIPIIIIASGTSDQLLNQVSSLDPSIYVSQFSENILELGEWFYRYFLPPALVLVVIGILASLFDSRRRSDLFLIVVALLPIALFTVLSRRWYPRYLVPSIFPLIIVLASQIVLLASRQKTVDPDSQQNRTSIINNPKLVAPVIAIIILPMLWFDLKLITDPVQTPLAREDKRQYIAGMPAGYGLRDAAGYLIQVADQGHAIWVWRNNRSVPPNLGLKHYLPRRDDIKLKTFRTDRRSWAEIEGDFDESAQEHLTYLVLNIPYEKGVPDLAEITRLEPLKSYPKPGDAGFYIGVYRWLSPLEYILLTSNLSPNTNIGLPSEQPIALLPTARDSFDLINLDASITDPQTLGQFIADEGLDYVVLEDRYLQEVGLLAEDGVLTRLPDLWSIEANYQNCRVCLFRIWEEDQEVPVASLDGGVQLASVQVPEAPWPNTELLQVTLYWRTSLPAPDEDLAVFLHAVNEQGQLVTQHDKTWLDAGFPALLRQPTDILSQVFELDLSSVQGNICLYAGIYRRSTGERLPAYQADQPLPDNAILLACGDMG
jgi:4-amino-4-deoxy-L-arabinose transferase-like glycosyltransferase